MPAPAAWGISRRCRGGRGCRRACPRRQAEQRPRSRGRACRRRGRARRGSTASAAPGSASPRSRASRRLHALRSSACSAPSQPRPRWPSSSVSSKPVPLEADRQVGRLLQLDDQDARADRVRRAGGDEHRVAGRHRQLVHRGQHLLARLRVASTRGPWRARSSCLKPTRTAGAGLGLEDDPRLGLAVVEAQLALGERAAGVEVHRQALAGVEQLGQQRRVGAVAGDVLGPEPPLRVGGDRVPHQRAVRGRREPAAVVGAERRVDGADPLLGHVVAVEVMPRNAAIRAPPA